MLLGRPVEGEAGVVLLGDVGRVLDPHDLDRVTLDVHPQDVAGVEPDLVGVVGQLDAARLAPPAHVHLGLDHDRIADGIGGGHGVIDRFDGPTVRHGDVEAGEELLALEFEEIHGAGNYLPGPPVGKASTHLALWSASLPPGASPSGSHPSSGCARSAASPTCKRGGRSPPHRWSSAATMRRTTSGRQIATRQVVICRRDETGSGSDLGFAGVEGGLEPGGDLVHR